MGPIKAKNGFSTLQLGGSHTGTPWDPSLGGLGGLKAFLGFPGSQGHWGLVAWPVPRERRAQGRCSPLISPRPNLTPAILISHFIPAASRPYPPPA